MMRSTIAALLLAVSGGAMVAVAGADPARAVSALSVVSPSVASPPVANPAEIVAAAPAGDWVGIAPADLLVMDLVPGAHGAARRVVIQLLPAPFSRAWVANIRTLAAARWWDGTSVNRVQDNYVVQWGDPDGEDKARAKPLPAGLERTAAAGYTVSQVDLALAAFGEAPAPDADRQMHDALDAVLSRPANDPGPLDYRATRSPRHPEGWHERDAYAEWVEVHGGWPLANQGTRSAARFWPVHCYGTVGVGRDMPPDAGSGAELYAVIGQAPRHLDRNIAVVGRVIEGIEHLSSLPRGTGALGFYRTAAERVGIVSVRMGDRVPGLGRYEYLSTESGSFARYAETRANRRDAFFVVPAGGVDVCNLPVPVRRVGG